LNKNQKISPVTDWKSITAACRTNNRQAQEKLYRHFFPIMERMVMRYTQDDDQIISILIEHKGSFEGWIRKLVYHSISNYFRKNNRDLKFLIFEEEFKKEPTAHSTHSLYYQDLMSLVDKLPEKQMKVFHLFAIEGFSHKEISEQLSLNENTCRWHLAEARKFLQKEYSRLFRNNINEAG